MTAPATGSADLGAAGPRVRAAVRADLPQVAVPAAEHAAYERAAPPAEGLAELLAAELFERAEPRLSCLVAELPGGVLAGYATCTEEFSTWQGRAHLHLDCLYLRDEHRGLGLGGLVIGAVVAEAGARGLAEVQWNTPVWNEGAIRFHDRLGATRKEKQRYSLAVPQA
ncbi:GNAT family N-acetyltransferase [Kitasatospora sp. NPDC048540]|uniref:GNAT family N-acetyltransferase n=1 Tax=Kitasatospora sp. NPDC048540 TaxID=3155634 RepID=UPI0033E1A4D3